MGAVHFLQILGMILLLEIFINTFVFNVTQVRGDSMQPTLESGDMLLLKRYKTFLNIEKYNRGDIIVFKSPLPGRKTHFIKRVIGVPGDRINIMEGKVHIDGEKIDEPYIQEGVYTETLIYGTDFTVPNGQVFVMGDNRMPGESTDSRMFSSISTESIEGKISFKYTAPNKIERNL